MAQAPLHLSPDATHPFAARGVAQRFRHAALFGAIDRPQPGETLRFANVHDPLPRRAQIRLRDGERVSVESRQREAGAIDFSGHRGPPLDRPLEDGKRSPMFAA